MQEQNNIPSPASSPAALAPASPQKLPLRVPANATPEQLEEAYAKGLLRKTELKDGAYYRGRCRNATVARWHEGRGVFLYIRTKFEHRFVEQIRHPADEQHYDVFVVLEELAADAVPEAQRIREETFQKWGA